MKKALAATAAVWLSLGLSVGKSPAQSNEPVFPANIRMIVPLAAGGPTDVLARIVAKSLSDRLGSTVYIENKPGASGAIGTEMVARSPADGGTLLLTATHFLITPSLMKNLPYDPDKDFSPIALIAATPNAIVVNSEFKAKNIKELLALLKAEPGKYTFGSAGTGSANHLSGELFKQEAGVNIVHLPYKGNGPAMTDLIGGHIPMLFDSLPTVVNAAKTGKVRVLAITGLKRSQMLPDAPTLDESGLKGFNVEASFALYMPQAHNSPVYKKLVQAMREVNQAPFVRERFAEMGIEPGQLFGDDYTAYVRREIARWKDVVRKANIEPE
ncbi:MAG: tripartite tricarboxylate transporter substrate binding protein [Pseudomonadota bacterium]